MMPFFSQRVFNSSSAQHSPAARDLRRATGPRANAGAAVGESARFQAVCVTRSWFCQSDVISSHLVVELVVELVETLSRHISGYPLQGANANASRWAALLPYGKESLWQSE